MQFMFLYAVLTVVFAFSSVVYELYLAQTLTSVLGGTNLRYATTIGLYITCMGIGAFIAGRITKKSPFHALFVAEILLIFAGFVSGPMVLGLELVRVSLSDLALVQETQFLSEVLPTMILILCHFPIVAIGILSGIELPLLMECSAIRKKEKSLFQSDVLAFDYLGTMLGAILFPFLLFPKLGVFGVCFLTMLFNAAGLCVFVLFERKKLNDWWPAPIFISILLLACSIALVVFRENMTRFFTSHLYGL